MREDLYLDEQLAGLLEQQQIANLELQRAVGALLEFVDGLLDDRVDPRPWKAFCEAYEHFEVLAREAQGS